MKDIDGFGVLLKCLLTATLQRASCMGRVSDRVASDGATRQLGLSAVSYEEPATVTLPNGWIVIVNPLGQGYLASAEGLALFGQASCPLGSSLQW